MAHRGDDVVAWSEEALDFSALCGGFYDDEFHSWRGAACRGVVGLLGVFGGSIFAGAAAFAVLLSSSPATFSAFCYRGFYRC